jgi:outer membrane lipoprotein-sorting protein
VHGRVPVVAGLAVAMALGAGWQAASAGETARGLLDRVRELNETTRKWTDREQRLDLTIVDRRGGERRRELQILTKKFGERGSRSILFFHAPPAVRGIGLLQWIEPGEPDRQWLYLPALKRVRQITGAGRQESFAGTDFSYEDLAIINEMFEWTEEEAPSALKAEEVLDGVPCAVIELTPRKAEAGYERLRVWLGRKDLVAHKMEFEVKSGRPEKTLLFSDIRPVGAIPSAHRLEMRNERSGSRTLVVLREIRYDTGLTDDVFSQRRLERGV